MRCTFTASRRGSVWCLGGVGRHRCRCRTAGVRAGSQRLPYLQAADVGVRQQEGVTPDQSIFHDYWSTVVSEGNFKKELFTPRLGQALIWTANLIHGGSG